MSERIPADLGTDVTTLGATGRRAARILATFGVLGLACAFALAATTADGWERFHASYLVNFVYFISLGLGALFFVLIQFATRAGWSVAIRRLAEGFAPNLFFPMAFLAVPVMVGLRTLYPWTDAAAVAADPLLRAKAAWLNVPFFLVRTVLYFGVWTAFATWFHRRSTRQDRTAEPSSTIRMETVSTAALILFAFSCTFFSFDYLMSLTPHWASTIYGVYFFAGCVLGFFALLIVVMFLVQAAGRVRRAVTTEHYHDMGKLVFAFVVFWAYIGFSQYMLIWYANLPEETTWLGARQTGTWMWLSIVLLVGHFVLPFLALISRSVKRRKTLLVTGACWMLLMHWVDIYWLVMPARSPDGVRFSPMDVAAFLGIGGLFFAAAARRLSAHSLVPTHDPRLAESLSFENF